MTSSDSFEVRDGSASCQETIVEKIFSLFLSLLSLFFNLVPSVCYTHCLCLRRGEKLAFLEKAISTSVEERKRDSSSFLSSNRDDNHEDLVECFSLSLFEKESLDTSSFCRQDDDLTTLFMLFPCQRILLLIYFRREHLSEKCSSSVYLHLFFC